MEERFSERRMSGTRPGVPPDFAHKGMESLKEAAPHLGIALTDEARGVIQKWFDFYTTWPGRRVIGFTDPIDVAVKLVLDSFVVGRALPDMPPGDALDLGSGNGWPGLALRLAMSPRNVSLLDSRKGACEFLRGFLAFSGLLGVTVVEARAEERAKAPESAGRYRVVTTRAMASPAVSLELAAGFLSLGGAAALWLGPEEDALPDKEREIPELGLGAPSIWHYRLPHGMGKRTLVVYRRISAIAPGYPRRIAAVKKRPLGFRF